MPTYHYACSSCSHEFDQYQSFTEDALSICPSCDGFIRRVIQPVGVVFKGTGWYLTDSRKADTSETSAGADKAPAADKSKDGADAKSTKAETPTSDGAAKKADAAPAAKSVESKTAPTTAS